MNEQNPIDVAISSLKPEHAEILNHIAVTGLVNGIIGKISRVEISESKGKITFYGAPKMRYEAKIKDLEALIAKADK